MIALFALFGAAAGFSAAALGLSLVRGGKPRLLSWYCPVCGACKRYDSLGQAFGVLPCICPVCSESTRSLITIAVMGVCAAIFCLGFAVIGLRMELAPLVCLVPVLIAVSVPDIEAGLIPNPIVLFGLLCGMALSGLSVYLPGLSIAPVDALAGAFIGAVPLFLITRLISFARGIDAMGLGDVKLMGMCGVFLGAGRIAVALLFGILSCALIMLPPLLLGKLKRTDSVSFGPFLAAGSVIALLFGDGILNTINFG